MNGHRNVMFFCVAFYFMAALFPVFAQQPNTKQLNAAQRRELEKLIAAQTSSKLFDEVSAKAKRTGQPIYFFHGSDT